MRQSRNEFFPPVPIALLLAGCIVAGCSKETPTPPGPAGERHGDADAAVQRVVEAATNVCDLFEMREQYAKRSRPSPYLMARIDRRMRWVTAATPTAPGRLVTNELRFVAFDFRKLGAERYRIYYAVQFERPFTEALQITTAAEPQDSNRAAVMQRKGWHGRWAREWAPPAGGWRRGESVVFVHEVATPEMPYRLMVDFALRPYAGASMRLLASNFDMGWRGSAPAADP